MDSPPKRPGVGCAAKVPMNYLKAPPSILSLFLSQFTSVIVWGLIGGVVVGRTCCLCKKYAGCCP